MLNSCSPLRHQGRTRPNNAFHDFLTTEEASFSQTGLRMEELLRAPATGRGQAGGIRHQRQIPLFQNFIWRPHSSQPALSSFWRAGEKEGDMISQPKAIRTWLCDYSSNKRALLNHLWVPRGVFSSVFNSLALPREPAREWPSPLV